MTRRRLARKLVGIGALPTAVVGAVLTGLGLVALGAGQALWEGSSRADLWCLRQDARERLARR